jgi:hypothetical protein
MSLSRATTSVRTWATDVAFRHGRGSEADDADRNSWDRDERPDLADEWCLEGADRWVLRQRGTLLLRSKLTKRKLGQSTATEAHAGCSAVPLG